MNTNKHRDHNHSSTVKNGQRRKLLKNTVLAAGAVAVLPSSWSKPVVNSILLPSHAQTTMMTIVETAVKAAPEFTTLVSALTTTGAVAAVQGPGPYTVFAPTNAAFEKIADTVAGLTTEQLVNVLAYHVLAGELPVSAMPATSGSPATVQATIQTSNGVIHVIDEVLLP